MEALPEWIDREAWSGFLEMRTKIKKPMTDRAKKMLIGRLIEMHHKGHDVNACIDQSTFHSWQDVYELKDKSISTVAKAPIDATKRLLAEQEAHRREAREAAERRKAART
jgi:hypothetical protein